jgi:hypothetical protein
MNVIINTINDIARFLKCKTSEIPQKISEVRECGIGLTLYYTHGGVMTTSDTCVKFPGKGSGNLLNPDITWNNIGTPISFKVWADNEYGWFDSDIFKFSHITTNALESTLNLIDDKMYEAQGKVK